MCRLYALMANEPTRAECSLVRSQNSLMRQSEGDLDGSRSRARLGRGGLHRWPAGRREAGLGGVPRRTLPDEGRARPCACGHCPRPARHGGHTSIENTHLVSPRALHLCAQRHHPGLRPGSPAHARGDRSASSRSDPGPDGQRTPVPLPAHVLVARTAERPGRHGPRGPGARAGGGVTRSLPASRSGSNIVLSDGRQMVASRLNRSLWISVATRSSGVPCASSRTYTTNRSSLIARWRWHRAGDTGRAVAFAARCQRARRGSRLSPTDRIAARAGESMPRSADPALAPTLAVYRAALLADALA